MSKHRTLTFAAVLATALCTACAGSDETPAEAPVSDPDTAAMATPVCDTVIADGVELTAAEACELALLRERCNEGDACLVDCIANGRDRAVGDDGEVEVIGGGCWHLCFAYSDFEWDVPEGFDACGEAG